MRPSVRIEGFDRLERKLAQLARAFERRRTAEIRDDAAEVVLAEMQRLVPVRTGALKDDLAIADSDDGLSVLIGPAGDTSWRAHFIEFGTVHMPAEPFIRPAFDHVEGQVTAKIARDLRSDILDVARG